MDTDFKLILTRGLKVPAHCRLPETLAVIPAVGFVCETSSPGVKFAPYTASYCFSRKCDTRPMTINGSPNKNAPTNNKISISIKLLLGFFFFFSKKKTNCTKNNTYHKSTGNQRSMRKIAAQNTTKLVYHIYKKQSTLYTSLTLSRTDQIAKPANLPLHLLSANCSLLPLVKKHKIMV